MSWIRVNKENRAAGVLENFAEGEKYTEHFLRKYVRNRTPEIMPSINSFFTDPKWGLTLLYAEREKKKNWVFVQYQVLSFYFLIVMQSLCWLCLVDVLFKGNKVYGIFKLVQVSANMNDYYLQYFFFQFRAGILTIYLPKSCFLCFDFLF